MPVAGSEHNVYNRHACDLHLIEFCPDCIQPVCDRCKQPAHRVTGATENGQPVEIWHHDSVADDVFCGIVMHAADRLPR